MAYKLAPIQLEEIARLPMWIQQYKDKYPVSISNIAMDYYVPILPFGYVPEDIDIYYEDDSGIADLSITRGKIEIFNINRPSNPNVIRIFIEGQCAYVEIEGKVLFNRLGAVKLPKVVMDPDTCAAIVLSDEPEEELNV